MNAHRSCTPHRRAQYTRFHGASFHVRERCHLETGPARPFSLVKVSPLSCRPLVSSRQEADLVFASIGEWQWRAPHYALISRRIS